jgi:toxin ParE1/3/4
MSPRIIKKPRAEHDLIEHFAFIAMDKLAPAERFLRVADESFAQLATTPKLGRKWESSQPHLAGIRVYPMPSGFRNYLIFYRIIEDGIEILTIMHGARDLGTALDDLFRDKS